MTKKIEGVLLYRDEDRQGACLIDADVDPARIFDLDDLRRAVSQAVQSWRPQESLTILGLIPCLADPALRQALENQGVHAFKAEYHVGDRTKWKVGQALYS